VHVSNHSLEHEGLDRNNKTGVNGNRTKGIRNQGRDKTSECDQNKEYGIIRNIGRARIGPEVKNRTDLTSTLQSLFSTLLPIVTTCPTSNLSKPHSKLPNFSFFFVPTYLCFICVQPCLFSICIFHLTL